MKLATLLALLGAAIAAAAAYIYATPTLRLPFFDDGDGPKLVLAGLGAGWAFVGTVQALRLGHGWLLKTLLALLTAASGLIFGGMMYHALAFARMLPPPAPYQEGLSRIPNFSLTDQQGKTVQASDLAGNRVVLGFYRGHLCPWCSRQLKDVQAKLKEIEAANGVVVFISTDSVEESREFARRLEVGFTLLSDPEAKAIKAFGLLHEMDMPIKKALARPAVLFVNGDGTIAHAWQPGDMRTTLSGDELMAAFSLTKMSTDSFRCGTRPRS